MGEKRSRGRQLRKEAAPARRAQRQADAIIAGMFMNIAERSHARRNPKEN
ncbi:hypothetical protein SEA_BANTAM_141 [Gordonia phage Bantam]|uniref:Uncharacterized protein n=1 Tax=Gordonia phage Bantam TaxID=1887641 RepID=A0A1B3AYJ1_9CAUD|nr:hypothetical protein BIZ77_gp038 [Gordonia phage Bantam]AOE43830.1 hypothetical protein SEA_BANTAM_141 [Gordonia phage Bantam]